MELLKNLIKNKMALIGFIVIGVFLFAGLLAPLISPHDPLAANLPNRLARPSSQNFLGTDELGRDVLSRIMYGARISLVIGTVSVALGLFLGAPLGAISGYYGGKIDLITQRFIDVLLAFPGMLLAIMVVSVLGVGLWNATTAGVGGDAQPGAGIHPRCPTRNALPGTSDHVLRSRIQPPRRRPAGRP